MYNWEKLNGKSGRVEDNSRSDGGDDIIESLASTNDEDGNEAETNGDDAEYECVPDNYIPHGYIFFMARGPFAEKNTVPTSLH